MKDIHKLMKANCNYSTLIISLISATVIVLEIIFSDAAPFLGVVYLGYKFLIYSFAILLVLTLIIYLILVGLSKIIDYSKKNGLLWGAICGSAIISLVALFLTNSYYWGGYFHRNPSDTFMDYFNMLNLLHAKDVYYLDANYPAMCFVFLKIMRTFIYIDRQAITSATDLRQDNMALVGYVMLIVLSLMIIISCTKALLCDDEDKRLASVIIFVGPMIALIERGNLLIVSLVCLMVYLRFYDSTDRRYRYLSYFALSFSASFKLYPALFGLLTLKRKNIIETVHLAIIGMVAFIAPFFYFDGVTTIKKWLGGMSAANELLTSWGVGGNFALQNFLEILGIIVGKRFNLSMSAHVVILIICLALALINRVQWETLFLIATACIWFPAFSFTYTLSLYIPAVIAYMNQNKEERSSFDGVLLIGTQMVWILPMLPYIDSYLDTANMDAPMNVSTLLINILIVALFIKVLLNMLARGLSVSREINIDDRKLVLAESIGVCLAACLIVVAGINRSGGLEDSFEGKGTSWNPYRIETADDLLELGRITNDGEKLYGIHFLQTADIEFDGVTPTNPIGWGKKDISFTGAYDGNGYSINNYYTLSDKDEDMGLFGTLSGEVINVCLDNCNIGGEYVGGIAYEVTKGGRVLNCSVNGLLWGYQAGGIASLNSGTIENCVAFVTMDATDKYGLSQDYSKGTIINSYTNIIDNTKKSNLINGDTLLSLNNKVDENNKNKLRDYTLCEWIIEDGLLKVSR